MDVAITQPSLPFPKTIRTHIPSIVFPVILTARLASTLPIISFSRPGYEYTHPPRDHAKLFFDFSIANLLP